MLIFLFTLRITSLSFAYLFDSRHAAAAVTGLVLLPLSLVAGYVVQFRDLSAWVGWLTYVSPHYWEVFNSPISGLNLCLYVSLRIRQGISIVVSACVKVLKMGLTFAIP